MADAVTKSTIASNVWNNIFELMDGIADPSSRATKWVFSSFPDKRADEKSTYPLIIVNPANVTTWDSITLSTNKIVRISVPIDVFTTNAQQLDEISDLVFAKINDNTSTLYGNSFMSISMDGGSYSNFSRSAFKVHMRTIACRINFHFER